MEKSKMRHLIHTDQDRAAFISNAMKITLDGKRCYVAEIKPFRAQRSVKSNRLYWMWLNCISKETGNDSDTLHQYFAEKYLAWEPKECLDGEVVKRRSTTSLDNKEFSEYLEQIRMQMINDYAIVLPEPGEQGWNEFYAQYGDTKAE
jgi:hypothetical protein